MATIAGNGQINGTDDADLITGGDGGDTIIGGGGNDTIDGGTGFNFVAYWTSPSGVGVQLFSGEAVTDGLGGHDTLINIQGVIGSGFDDYIMGTSFTDVLIGLSGNDYLSGIDGDDILVGGPGNDTLDGGAGFDKAIYSGNRADYTVAAITNGFTITDNRAGTANEGSDTVLNVESFQFANGTLTAADLVAGTNLTPNTGDPSTPTTPDAHFSVFRDGSWSDVTAAAYSGPVTYLQFQLLGTSSNEVAIGTSGNDFINLLGGDDAANGGAGNDVLDGGTGSNFLTGGAGTDVFFLDGRSGQVTWSTITDWQAGEQLSLWGWHPGVSHATWVSNAGAAGYQGVTMHADLDGNGTIDASVTWTGMTQAQLPTPIEMDGLLWFK